MPLDVRTKSESLSNSRNLASALLMAGWLMFRRCAARVTDLSAIRTSRQVSSCRSMRLSNRLLSIIFQGSHAPIIRNSDAAIRPERLCDPRQPAKKAYFFDFCHIQLERIMTIEVVKPERSEMLNCVARYSELKPVTTGLPDMQLEQCKRTFLSVLGFEQPRGDIQHSPFGNHVSPRISSKNAGYGAAFVRAQPGRGVLMHAHDTTECFMPIEGRWMVQWEGNQGAEHVVLDPLDFIAVPVGVQRRFECIEVPAGKEEGILFAIISGQAPAVEWSPESVKLMAESGKSVVRTTA